MALYTALGVAVWASTACVSIRSADRLTLPDTWQSALPRQGAPFRDPSGEWSNLGQRAGDGRLAEATLTAALFPGRRVQTSRYRLAFDAAASRLGVTPLDGANAGRTTFFAAAADPFDGSLLLPDVPVRGSSFGASVDRNAVRLYVGHDGALYSEIRASTVGVSLFVPVMGSAQMWARWESAKVNPTPPSS